jgi:type IV pilus assembly protein PilW
MKYPIQQQGLSLVELMVAVTLSLILSAGVIQVYISSKTSYRIQQELSTLQDNQRIAVELLGNQIRKAGLSVNQIVSAFDTSDIDNWDGGIENGVAQPDQITIMYESPSSCTGSDTSGDDGIATDRFFIDEGQLKCNGNGDTQPLVSGIEDMQILYGVDTSPIVPGEVRTADKYVPPSVDIMDDVVSVRIALLFRTDGGIRSTEEAEDTNRNYSLLDAPTRTFNDRVRREVITTTITLRNST